jgi:ribosomal protein L37AE/L43A
MQIDPVLEWQRLVAEYRQKSPEELLELAADFADLTEPAQQALRSEMRSRGLGDPESARSAPEPQPTPKEPPQAPLPLRNAPWAGDPVDIAFDSFPVRVPELVPDTPDTEDKVDGPHDYTWKTVLCECETSEQAQQLVEALQKAGIDGWVDGPRSSAYSSYAYVDIPNPRVLVAADQLDQARAIAAKPVPQEIVEEEKEEVPEFVEPKCPKCGSDDVVLEGVDPENTWRCEQCGEQWTETLPKTEGDAPKAAQNTL